MLHYPRSNQLVLTAALLLAVASPLAKEAHAQVSIWPPAPPSVVAGEESVGICT